MPTVTIFEFDEAALELLNVKRFEGYSKEWAEFILMNRSNDSDAPAHQYDVVIGPIADDGVGTQIRRQVSIFKVLFMFLIFSKRNFLKND